MHVSDMRRCVKYQRTAERTAARVVPIPCAFGDDFAFSVGYFNTGEWGREDVAKQRRGL